LMAIIDFKNHFILKTKGLGDFTQAFCFQL